jgi:hypothetical protein
MCQRTSGKLLLFALTKYVLTQRSSRSESAACLWRWRVVPSVASVLVDRAIPLSRECRAQWRWRFEMEPFGAFVDHVSLNREAYCVDGCCRSQSRSPKLFWQCHLMRCSYLEWTSLLWTVLSSRNSLLDGCIVVAAHVRFARRFSDKQQ